MLQTLTKGRGVSRKTAQNSSARIVLKYISFVYLLYKQSKSRIMKRVFVLRFGVPGPTRGDHMAIDAIGCRETSSGCGTPFGVLSIFGTDLSPSEVTAVFKQVELECNDQLPVLVWTDGDAIGVHLSPEFFEHFEPMKAEWEQEHGSATIKCTLSLDDLLDLVAMKGMKGLTEEQLTRLKELSK